MKTTARQPTLLVYQPQRNASLAEVFANLGFNCEFSTSVNELTTKLGTMTYSGLCIVAAMNELTALRSLFFELEVKAMLEGLRAVLIVPRSGTSIRESIVQMKDLPWLQKAGVAFFRDIIEVAGELNPVEREETSKRLNFVFQYNTKNPFAARFPSLVRWKANAEIHVPARLSWFDDSNNTLGVEAGAQLTEGLPVRLRIETSNGAQMLHGNVKQNLPAELRFNYGNSLSIELNDGSALTLKRIIRNEAPEHILTLPLRRAFIVTRSVALRQRIVRALSKHQVDCRIPLVKRNIISDLPLLSPHFVLFEDRVLEELMAKETKSAIELIRQNAGSQARVGVVGDNPGRLAETEPGLRTFPLTNVLEVLLTEWLNTTPTATTERNTANNRTWFSFNSRTATATLMVEEKTHFLSADGIVLRGSNHYRIWNNIEITLPGTPIQFVGKATGTFLVCDPFRNSSHVAIKDTPVLTFFTALTKTPDLAKEAVKSLKATLTEVSFAYDFSDGALMSPAAVVVPEKAKAIKAPPLVAPEKPVPVVDARKAREHRQSVIYMFLAMALIGLLVYIMVKAGEESSSAFSRSFKSLFSNQGR